MGRNTTSKIKKGKKILAKFNADDKTSVINMVYINRISNIKRRNTKMLEVLLPMLTICGVFVMGLLLGCNF